MRNSKAQYAIITDLKNSFSPRRELFAIKFLRRLGKSYIQLLWAYLFNRNKCKAYKARINTLKKFYGFVAGHEAVLLSLFRGFKDLGIAYTFNKITPDTQNVILCWCNRDDLKVIDTLKKQGKIKKVVTAPTAYQYDYDLQFEFPEYECIDKVLVASQQAKEMLYLPVVPDKYIDKVVSWPSGVDLPEQIKQARENSVDCLCFYKKVPVSQELQKILKDNKISYMNLEYATYEYEDWVKLLDKVKLVIFIQKCIETQGLAIAEAWAHDRPTIVKTKDKSAQYKTAPYLTNKNGMFFEDWNDLEEVLKIYAQDRDAFLKRFQPRKYVEEEMSDKVSVQQLIDIFEKI